MNINISLGSLIEDEMNFLSTSILSPRIPGQDIRVRISGVVVRLSVSSRFHGWGRFRPLSWKKAEVERIANPDERQGYLSLLPAVWMIITRTEPVMGVIACRGDSRIRINREVPIHLSEDCQLFDTIVARCDGQSFWYDQFDSGRPFHFAGRMRESLANDKDLDIKGCSLEEREAYKQVLDRTRSEQSMQAERSTEGRIQKAVSHSGGKYISHIERDSGYVVEFDVDGHRRTVRVKDDLRVEAAGICLDGNDSSFDLASLVGVIREGYQGGHIYNIPVR